MGNDSVPKFIFRFSRFPVYRGSVLDRFYCIKGAHKMRQGPTNRSFVTTVSQLKICDFFREKRLKVLKCYNFLWVQRRHNCPPAASFANCVMTLYLLKVHLQTFLSIPITQKMPNFELWHSCRFYFSDVLLLHYVHLHVSANYVAIFRVISLRTRIHS
jgi:hypothetical protein